MNSSRNAPVFRHVYTDSFQLRMAFVFQTNAFSKISNTNSELKGKTKKKVKCLRTNSISTILVFIIFVLVKEYKINDPKDSLDVFTKRCLNDDYTLPILLNNPLSDVARDKEKNSFFTFFTVTPSTYSSCFSTGQPEILSVAVRHADRWVVYQRVTLCC